MLSCPNCGKRIVKPNQKFCVACGATFEPNEEMKRTMTLINNIKNCPNCGAKIVKFNQRFCVVCAADILAEVDKQKQQQEQELKQKQEEKERYMREIKLKTDELNQKRSIIESFLSQKNYADANRALEEMIQEAKSYKIQDILDWAQKKYTSSLMVEKMTGLFSISEKVNINDVLGILDLDRPSLFKKLIEWGKMFDIKIDGDFIKVKAEDLDGLMNVLDQSYTEWGSEQGKVQKKT